MRYASALPFALCSVLATPVIGSSATETGHAKFLSCFYGGVGEVPDPIPSGYETEFADGEVEITNVREVRHATVSGFILTDASGRVTRMRRVVDVRVRDVGRAESWP